MHAKSVTEMKIYYHWWSLFLSLADEIKLLKSIESSKTFCLHTKTKTLIFVLEAPRDQDFVVEDNITGLRCQEVRGQWVVVQ